MRGNFVFASESVTDGHPDKLCDQISDAIVDRFLTEDPLAQVSAECAAASGILFLAVRFASFARPDIGAAARGVIAQVGYEERSFNPRDCTIIANIREMPLSVRIAEDEDAILSLRAKHHGTLFGYACTQSPGMIPIPIWLAHRLALTLSQARRQISYLLPDGQVQVGVEYQGGKPKRIQAITLIASQKEEGQPKEGTLTEDLMDKVVAQVFKDEMISPDPRTHIHINPEGPVVGGGPALHAGLTGRKTGIDTYGEYSRHSGTALSGKDPQRIDRIGAYMARLAAKTVVAAGLAEECDVALTYTIGEAAPVSVQANTFGTGAVSDDKIAQALREIFDFRLGAIIRDLRLRRLPMEKGGSFYRDLAVFGHMGRVELDAPWEQVHKTEALTKLLNI